MLRKMTSIQVSKTKQLSSTAHLSSLDGFRACLALWVYLGHLAAAVGFENKVLNLHPLAVDLFMVLSGFLMVYTWKFPQDQKLFFRNSLSFYCNRFFRIAPLYYFLLFVCYLWTPTFDQMHDFALKEIPPLWAKNIVGFDPHTARGYENISWVLMHASLLFGIVPGMENNSPLPDWSLSLEIQFYLVFPILLIGFKKRKILVIAVLSATAAALSPKLFGNYLDAGILTHFGQPSFLPYRLNAFVAGMILAIWLKNDASNNNDSSTKIYSTAAVLFCLVPLNKFVILAYIVFVLLVMNKSPRLSKLLNLKPLRFLGNISYSIYLAHVLVVTPIVYLLIKKTPFLIVNPSIRFTVGVAVTAPVVVLSSSLLYAMIEKPSITLGRKLSNGFMKVNGHI